MTGTGDLRAACPTKTARVQALLAFVAAWGAMCVTEVGLRSWYYSSLGGLRDAAHWSEFLGTAMMVVPPPFLLAAVFFAALAAMRNSRRISRTAAGILGGLSVPLVALALFVLGHLLGSRVSMSQDVVDILRHGWISPAISVLALAIGALIVGVGSSWKYR